MDIDELAKEVTRENFINESINERKCPSEIGLEDINMDILCGNHCKKCWTNAVEDIKFKDDMEKTQGEKIQEFHKNNKTWMQQAMEHVEPVIREELKKAISNYMEGEKMSDNKIVVKCIKDTNSRYLTNNEEYTAVEEKEFYVIKINGDEKRFDKNRFKKIEEINSIEKENNLIDRLRKELEGERKANTFLENESRKYQEKAIGLENAIEITKNKGIEWMNKYNETKEKLDKADSEAKRLGISTNEYYYNWIECQKENKMLKDHIKEIEKVNSEINNNRELIYREKEKFKAENEKLKETIKGLVNIL